MQTRSRIKSTDLREALTALSYSSLVVVKGKERSTSLKRDMSVGSLPNACKRCTRLAAALVTCYVTKAATSLGPSCLLPPPPLLSASSTSPSDLSSRLLRPSHHTSSRSLRQSAFNASAKRVDLTPSLNLHPLSRSGGDCYYDDDDDQQHVPQSTIRSARLSSLFIRFRA
jgi:hypothetical protein